MLTFSRLGRSLQQDDAEAEHSGLIAEDVACDGCILAEAGMVLLAFLWGPGMPSSCHRLLFALLVMSRAAPRVPGAARTGSSVRGTHQRGPNGCSAGPCPQEAALCARPGAAGSCRQLPAAPAPALPRWLSGQPGCPPNPV